MRDFSLNEKRMYDLLKSELYGYPFLDIKMIKFSDLANNRAFIYRIRRKPKNLLQKISGFFRGSEIVIGVMNNFEYFRIGIPANKPENKYLAKAISRSLRDFGSIEYIEF